MYVGCKPGHVGAAQAPFLWPDDFDANPPWLGPGLHVPPLGFVLQLALGLSLKDVLEAALRHLSC